MKFRMTVRKRLWVLALVWMSMLCGFGVVFLLLVLQSNRERSGVEQSREFVDRLRAASSILEHVTARLGQICSSWDAVPGRMAWKVTHDKLLEAAPELDRIVSQGQAFRRGGAAPRARTFPAFCVPWISASGSFLKPSSGRLRPKRRGTRPGKPWPWRRRWSTGRR